MYETQLPQNHPPKKSCAVHNDGDSYLRERIIIYDLIISLIIIKKAVLGEALLAKALGLYRLKVVSREAPPHTPHKSLSDV